MVVAGRLAVTSAVRAFGIAESDAVMLSDGNRKPVAVKILRIFEFHPRRAVVLFIIVDGTLTGFKLEEVVIHAAVERL